VVRSSHLRAFPGSRDGVRAADFRVSAFHMHTLTRLWRGEIALDVAFWNWAVLGGLTINLTTSVLSLLLIMNGYPITALIVGYAHRRPRGRARSTSRRPDQRLRRSN
jgi:hypothetical protein